MRTCHVVLFVLGCLVATADGQQPPPVEQPTFRAEVALVEVVAVVTGEDDRGLTGLALDDFDVREDGEPCTLLSARRLSTSVADTAALPTHRATAHLSLQGRGPARRARRDGRHVHAGDG